jgi:hypothetical protein
LAQKQWGIWFGLFPLGINHYKSIGLDDYSSIDERLEAHMLDNFGP